VVEADSSNSVIQNNTIDGGSNPDTVMVYLSGSRPVIENNILYASAGCCAVYEKDAASRPARLRNNAFSECAGLYVKGEGGSCDSAVEIETYLTPAAASGNIADDPDPFVNRAAGDYHLTAGSAPEHAGLDLSAEFATDRDGAPRSAPWSMGAYE